MDDTEAWLAGFARPDPLKRFMGRVKVNDKTGCWEWQGALTVQGYGQFQYDHKIRYAHRAAWELMRGPIPENYQVDHLCRVRHCVNPEHLEPVTALVNVRRKPEFALNTCKRGHPWNEEHTGYRIIKGKQWRFCKTCHRERERARRAAWIANDRKPLPKEKP